MRIMHGFHNIAGIPVTLSHSERAIGLNSETHCHPSSYQGDMIDHVVHGDTAPLLSDHLERFDVFNFHFGYSYYRQSLADLPLLKASGKRVLMHYHGCDLRNAKLVAERHPISACAECWPVACNANRVATRHIVRDNADIITVSTPDLLEFEPQARWMPQPVDIDWIETNAATGRSQIMREPGSKTIWVVHAPSSTRLKGTRFVEEAVETLRSKGLDIQLCLLTGMSRENVLATIQDADFVVDQMLIGAYGVMAIEAMALRKPVICYIHADVASHLGPACPIIHATPLDLADVIAATVAAEDRHADLGARGRTYVEAIHGPAASAARIRDWYAELAAR